MLKRFVIGLSVVLSLSFTGCGGESSDEAKEFLTKILQFVGIPHSIIVNVCQDSNRDGICGAKELFTKVTINKGDEIDDILRKISLTSNGRYFLETYNPELPILVEFQDIAKVNFDDGKFTLSFNGFETTKDDNETKEVSVLESMVDANALSKDIADKFRTLDNAEAQEKYYSALFESLETNINTLRREDLDKDEATKATIKEMAEATKINQEQANRINSCGNDQSCVDEEIKKVLDELIITDEETTEITGKEIKPTPTPSSTPIAGEEVVYGKWVKPSQSVCESNGGEFNSYGKKECMSPWEKAKNICKASGDELPTIETLHTLITNCGGVLDYSESNIYNELYQSCYKEKGFTDRTYWSSTPYIRDPYAWIVLFLGGHPDFSFKANNFYIRCVRGGQ